MLKGKKYVYPFLFLLTYFFGCVEPFEIVPQAFEDVLIVEGTLTNEEKRHSINLSRTTVLGSTQPLPVEGANVSVIQDNANTILFNEVSPGVYESAITFQAIPGSSYQLSIQTSDGKSYQSSSETLPSQTQIDEVVARSTTNDEGIDGVEIVVNSYDPTGQSQFYRYSYEETFKIIAPQWRPLEAFVVSEEPPQVEVRPRSQEEQVCFSSASSPSTLLFSTATLTEDRVLDLPVRFIEKLDFIIAHRYSILVKQMVQSEGAFEFYTKLEELSSQGNLLSQSQPGFLLGNILPEEGDPLSVTGYFDVAQVSEQRIFFNYEDIFGAPESRAYAVGCDQVVIPSLERDQFGNSEIIFAIENELLEYLNDSVNMGGDTPEGNGPYQMVPRICGDCTVLGSNVVPEFWVED